MIKNINKRFIASSIAFVLLPSVLTGCTQELKYEEDENGQVIVSGNISYNSLKSYYFVEIDNPDFDIIEYYITKRSRIKHLEDTVYNYINIFTDKEVFRRKENSCEYCYKTGYDSNDVVTNRKFIKEIKIEDYLLSENFIKNTYTIDDVKQIFDAIKENEQGKKLVKE